MDALLGRQVELVAGLHVERLVPGVNVADDAVHAILARAVLVGDDLLAFGILTLLFLPRLGVGDEEALIAGKAVDHRRRAVLGLILLVSGIGRLDARQVADILAQRQLAVDRQVGERLERIILGNERVGLGRERLRGLWRPPVAQLALGVELAALVVEPVAHFVAGYGANRAVIGRR